MYRLSCSLYVYMFSWLQARFSCDFCCSDKASMQMSVRITTPVTVSPTVIFDRAATLAVAAVSCASPHTYAPCKSYFPVTSHISDKTGTKTVLLYVCQRLSVFKGRFMVNGTVLNTLYSWVLDDVLWGSVCFDHNNNNS